MQVATLNGGPPIIIAHRGASGERPEHTLAAYALAVEQGADFIEPDLVLTKDGILVARHENDISETTDVADKPEFADRKTVKMIDGQRHEGWFTEDFTLAELKTLRAKERLPQLRAANATYDGRFEIPTFEEILQLLQRREQQRGKRIGVYPETKHPSYFKALGLDHDEPLLKLLKQYGYGGKDDPVFIQSFEVGNLQALNKKTEIRLVQLVASEAGPPDIDGQTYAAIITADGLKKIVSYADGIGPSKDLVIDRNLLGQQKEPSGLVAAAHKAGLVVHPWTFRRENYFLPTDFKSGIDPREPGDLAGEVRAYVAAGVDGLFSDNPDQAVAAIKR
ncbi:MAG: glycerophosphodiester phosphodiesterase [Sphingomonadales bacterium]|nr:glycerophosphodiester phosphodiesterase [Sphingomonadales bacterium]PIX64241.1 MAG: glycerophosphodiester phosphodiesterase [Sphingomonadales bacterium CG_4_10_14_3_um_filter_58_15]NCO50181.1 glycerophosphodiester phosphodiesterase [Sphingomonadales bacterium]NCP00256.1 glycerophosphodiester phosphodiesterase [Sphingomonadales bacterium]NCP27736.1 glycerophosphodiester phosphodiesterase [Sphingomonadales bacterium]